MSERFEALIMFAENPHEVMETIGDLNCAGFDAELLDWIDPGAPPTIWLVASCLADRRRGYVLYEKLRVMIGDADVMDWGFHEIDDHADPSGRPAGYADLKRRVLDARALMGLPRPGQVKRAIDGSRHRHQRPCPDREDVRVVLDEYLQQQGEAAARALLGAARLPEVPDERLGALYAAALDVICPGWRQP